MRPRVVIVDDSPQVAATYEIGLAAAGYDAIAVTRAVDAIAEIENGASALITDLDMPRMDGFELISKLRAIPAHVNLPIVVVSGSTEPGAESRARAAGANAYFTKPCSPALLRQELDRFFLERPKVES